MEMTLTIWGNRWVELIRKTRKHFNGLESEFFKYSIMGESDNYMHTKALLKTNDRYRVKLFLDAAGLKIGCLAEKDAYSNYVKSSCREYRLEKR